MNTNPNQDPSRLTFFVDDRDAAEYSSLRFGKGVAAEEGMEIGPGRPQPHPSR